ncbi:MAG: tRNA adenosine(34) deaminase TadA [Clostridia bacterium]|nr:tRNA adenosine(34) deaminase TadA [Clostridia bacterium]
MQENIDEKFMREAICEAQRAEELDEVPVGAVIVRGGEVIARAYNSRERDKNALCHAEIKAINEACELLGGWRLVGCTLYVTLEPCPMCAGAIVNARVERVVYGAPDMKAGAFGTMINLNDYPLFKPEIVGGILKNECAQLLSDFFKKKRNK